MLYVVTTTAFDGAPTLGVFTEYNLAVAAIREYVNDHDELGPLEGDTDEYFAFDEMDGYYVIFYIETCYPNVSLV